MWASPQFTFKTFQAGKSDLNPSSYLYYENTPTQTVEVRRSDPAPFRDGYHSHMATLIFDSDNPTTRDVFASGIFNESAAPSAPPVSEDILKGACSLNSCTYTPRNYIRCNEYSNGFSFWRLQGYLRLVRQCTVQL